MLRRPALPCVVLLIGCGTPALAHDVFPSEEDINPKVTEADRSNAKLNFLQSRARLTGVAPGELDAARAIFYTQYRWRKTNLSVCFWNGTEDVQREIMQLANVWHDAVPSLVFTFEQNGKVRSCQVSDMADPHKMADIRIVLDASDPRQSLWNQGDLPAKQGDWSHVGASVSQNNAYPITMSLGSAVRMRAQHMPLDYAFNVRHEFGHALGLAHEHQRSICNGWFNIKEIARSQGWTEQFAAAQVGSLGQTSNTFGVIGTYDKDSIMQYNFEPSWYMPDRPPLRNPCRRDNMVDNLSEMDKIAIAQIYEPTLNDTAARTQFIKEQKALASVSPSSTNPNAALATVDSESKKSVEAALAAFKANIGLPEKISIQLFLKPGDREAVLKAVSNLGYPVTDASGNPIITRGHPWPALINDPTNAIWFTRDVQEEDVRYIAASLVGSGIQIKSVDVYEPSEYNGFRKRANVVQIGSSQWNRTRVPLTEEQIMTAKLPLFGANK